MSGSSAPARATRCSSSSRAADASSCRRPGRTSRTRVVEALAIGTPVVATRRRRCARDRPATARTGCSSTPATTAAFAAALERVLRDDELRARLRGARPARSSASRPTACSTRARSASATGGAVKPRVLFVGRTRYRLPLDDALRGNGMRSARCSSSRPRGSFDRSTADASLAPSSGSTSSTLRSSTGRCRSGSPRAAHLPGRAWSCARALETAAVLVARNLTRSNAAVVAEVHGDWRTLTRLYGSRARRFAAPVADAAAGPSPSAQAVAPRLHRAISCASCAVSLTRVSRRGPDPRFVGSDPSPLPAEPRAIFIGALQPYKNVDGLVATWRGVVREVPDAVLHVVGNGPQSPSARRDGHPATIESVDVAVAASRRVALDGLELLVSVPPPRGARSRRDRGARPRPSGRSSRPGGIPDLVTDGENGELYDPDPDDCGVTRCDCSRCSATGHLRASRRRACRRERWLVTPEESACRASSSTARVRRVRLVVITQASTRTIPRSERPSRSSGACCARRRAVVLRCARDRRPSCQRSRAHVRRGAVPRSRGAARAFLRPSCGRRPVAVLAHMAPITPSSPRRSRGLSRSVVLWFTHWRDSRTLSSRSGCRRRSSASTTFVPAALVQARRDAAHGIEVPDEPVSVRRRHAQAVSLGRT